MAKQNSISKTLIWILMGLLILGLGGFGVTNLGGAITSVGSVDDKDIDVNDYARALQQEMNNLQEQTGQRFSFAQAQSFGVDQQVLGRLVTARALDAEAARLGLSMGDENLRDELLAIPAFQGVDGSFDREAYRFALQQAGLSEAEFEDSLREDAARSLLQTAVVAGLNMPGSYADAILAYLGESRNFSVATVTEAALAEPIGTPDTAALRSFYDENIALFMRPATRNITYAWVTPEMLIDTVDVDEQMLRDLYADREAEYNRPERRLVERLVMGDESEASSALDRIAEGTLSFEDLVESRGLSLIDVDMGDVTQATLGAAGDLVFAADVGALVGPVKTDLGPAIFRVNGILEAQLTPYEDALPELREQLATDRARRLIDASIDEIDDLLAGGATLEEAAAETDLEVAEIEWHAGLSGGIAGYEDFRRIASVVTEADFPAVEQLDDGGIFALRLNGETEAAPAPFEDSQDEIAAAWRQATLIAALEARAAEFKARLDAGANIITLGLTVLQEQDVTRSDFLADLPANVIEEAFALDYSESTLVSAQDRVLILQLDNINPANLEAAESESLRNIISLQATQSLAQEIYESYAAQIRTGAAISINQQAVNAVHAQMQ